MTRRLVAAATALAALAIAPARAGWRPVEMLLVDAGRRDPVDIRCVVAIANQLREAGEDLVLSRRTLDKIRLTLPADLAPSILTWTAADLRATRARADGSTYDAVVVVDCRPDAGTVDVVIARNCDEVATLRLRGLPPRTSAPPAATIAWLTARIESASYVGFSP